MARGNNGITFPPEWRRYRARRRGRAAPGWLWLVLAMVVAFGMTLAGLQGNLPVPWGRASYDLVDMPLRLNVSADTLRGRFSMCHSGGGTNCVVDGDTFWFQGQKIRIADIDTPETHPARCAEEARLGAAATDRLQGLLNAGAFSLEGGDTDRYGRALRTVTRDGESLGGVLVDEGLARWYAGGRQPWC
jgi:endonuclease YncB( thermonuclease family)